MSLESKQSKKEAIQKYKERKPQRGIFAVRCPAEDRVWVGASLNVDATKNSLWFRLRLGGKQDPDLLHAWQTHGEAAFTYEILELLDDGLIALEKSPEDGELLNQIFRSVHNIKGASGIVQQLRLGDQQ